MVAATSFPLDGTLTANIPSDGQSAPFCAMAAEPCQNAAFCALAESAPYGFEGSEKRLELDFTPAALSGAGFRTSLRSLTRPQLDNMLRLATCEIVSERKGKTFDAYVLSESSLFIYDRKLVLKTCGITGLLCAVPEILSLASSVGLKPCRVKYSRASYLFSGSYQKAPHRDFVEETNFLNIHFGGLGEGGRAEVIGDAGRANLRWHVYTAEAKTATPTFEGKGTFSFELCMTGLDRSSAEHFFKKDGVTSQMVTEASGIRGLFPEYVIDDFAFEPCGYSMNAVCGDSFSTIHITPEEGFSYASVEVSCMDGNEFHISDMVKRSLAVFKPSKACLCLSGDGIAPVNWLLDVDCGAEYEPETQMGNVRTAGGGFVRFQALQAVQPTSPKPALSDEGFLLVNKAAVGEKRGNIVTPDNVFEFPDETCSGDESDSNIISRKSKRMRTMLEPFEELYAKSNFQVSTILKSLQPHPIFSGAAKGIDGFIHEVLSTGKVDPEEDCFYVVDVGVVMRRWQFWRESLPRVEPHYAVKCSPEPALLSVLAALGAGFDCASPAELDAILSLGVPKDKIIYANPCKFPKDISYAKKLEVPLTTFDTESELIKMKKLFPEAELVLRIRADDPNARCALGTKYGAEQYEVEGLLRKAKELGLNVVGIAFHVGSGASDPKAFRTALQLSRIAFDLAKEVGFKLRLLDIGGGFSGGSEGAEGVLVGDVAPLMNQTLEEIFPASEGVRVIAEPGRYFAEAMSTLVTKVFGRRVRPQETESHAYWVGDGIYGSMNCLLYDHAVLKARALAVDAEGQSRLDGSALRNSAVFGPTCDGLDKVLQGHQLPELEVGDYIVWPSMGAYTTAACTSFNGFSISKSPTFYVISEGGSA